MELRKTRHSVYNINYHFVWIPKYRRSILTGQIKADLEDLIKSYALKNEVIILSLSIQPDHVQLGSQAIQDIAERIDRGYKLFFRNLTCTPK